MKEEEIKSLTGLSKDLADNAYKCSSDLTLKIAKHIYSIITFIFIFFFLWSGVLSLFVLLK